MNVSTMPARRCKFFYWLRACLFLFRRHVFVILGVISHISIFSFGVANTFLF